MERVDIKYNNTLRDLKMKYNKYKTISNINVENNIENICHDSNKNWMEKILNKASTIASREHKISVKSWGDYELLTMSCEVYRIETLNLFVTSSSINTFKKINKDGLHKIKSNIYKMKFEEREGDNKGSILPEQMRAGRDFERPVLEMVYNDNFNNIKQSRRRICTKYPFMGVTSDGELYDDSGKYLTRIIEVKCMMKEKKEIDPTILHAWYSGLVKPDTTKKKIKTSLNSDDVRSMVKNKISKLKKNKKISFDDMKYMFCQLGIDIEILLSDETPNCPESNISTDNKFIINNYNSPDDRGIKRNISDVINTEIRIPQYLFPLNYAAYKFEIESMFTNRDQFIPTEENMKNMLPGRIMVMTYQHQSSIVFDIINSKLSKTTRPFNSAPFLSYDKLIEWIGINTTKYIGVTQGKGSTVNVELPIPICMNYKTADFDQAIHSSAIYYSNFKRNIPYTINYAMLCGNPINVRPELKHKLSKNTMNNLSIPLTDLVPRVTFSLDITFTNECLDEYLNNMNNIFKSKILSIPNGLQSMFLTL